MSEGPAEVAMRDRGHEQVMRATPLARRSRGAQRASGRRRLSALRTAALCIALTVAPHHLAAQTDADEDYVGPLVNQALETEKSGVAVPWSNPATGSSGTIAIERTFYRDPRTPCRDYRRTLERAGAPPVEIQGTGCRIGPSRWSLDEEKPTPAAASVTAPSAGAGMPPPRQATEPPEVEPAAGPTPPSCPAPSAAPVACTKPPAVVDYTMPARTEL
jgi:surface antigen